MQYILVVVYKIVTRINHWRYLRNTKDETNNGCIKRGSQ